MSDVTITGITVLDRPPADNGSRLLGYFDCEVNGIRLLGCSLVKTPKKGFVASAPKIPGQQGGRCAVLITDNALRHRMMEAARIAYRALGGKEAEWTPMDLT